MARHLVLTAALGVVGLMCAAGCSRDSVIRGTVSGKVTLDGAPLTNASVFFEGEGNGVAMLSPIGPNGEFTVATHGAKGLPVGAYKVAITPGGVMDPSDAPILAGKDKTKNLLPVIPKKYTATSTSGLTAEVKEGDNPPLVFALVKE